MFADTFFAVLAYRECTTAGAQSILVYLKLPI